MDGSREPQLRTPPQSIEAEQAVLGGLFLVSRAWWDVCDILTDADFYRRDHALIWRAIKQMADAERPFDAVTIGDWFNAKGHGDQIENGAYLIELASTTPSAANIRAYAEIVADKARLRRLIEVGTAIVHDGFQPDGRATVEIIGTAQTKIGSLLDTQPCDLEGMVPILQRVFDRLQDRYEKGPGIKGITTGLDRFDDLINGMAPGQLLILAARPGMGKTTLAQNIAEHVAINLEKPVSVFSFEMQNDELGDRMLSSIGGIDGDKIRRGELDDEDWSKVTAAIRKLRGAPISISPPRSARVEHVVAQIRRQHAKKPIGLVVIDYLQLMQVSGDNRAQGYGDVTRALKLMAGELGIPVLLLSQLNRELEKRHDKRPVLSDLRDSGAIEQDADVVVFIYQDEIYFPGSEYRGTAELIVGKQRNGRRDTVRVLSTPHRYRFDNLPIDWEPVPAPEREVKRSGFRNLKGNPNADKAAGPDR